MATVKENGNSVYAFNIGQKVRIKSTLTCDTTGIEDILGQIGIVESRRFSIFSGATCYKIRVGNRVEPFKEYELDYRYGKRT